MSRVEDNGMKDLRPIAVKDFSHHSKLYITESVRGEFGAPCYVVNLSVGCSGIERSLDANNPPKEAYVVSINFLKLRCGQGSGIQTVDEDWDKCTMEDM